MSNSAIITAYFIGNIYFPYPNIIIHTGWELAIELSGKCSAFCSAQLEMFDLTRVKRKINWQFPSQPLEKSHTSSGHSVNVNWHVPKDWNWIHDPEIGK